MRVAVVGATGAVGEAVVDALRHDPHKRVDAVVGIAQRLPTSPRPDVQWHALDPATADLTPHLRGVDALVNVGRARAASTAPGAALDDAALARRVLETAVRAGVLNLVQLSSFLAYAPAGPGGAAVDEGWPTDGLPTSPASRSAAALERLLDEFGAQHEVARMVRIRSGLVLGPGVRQQVLARRGLLAGLLRLVEHVPVVPGLDVGGVPVVHHDDLAAAVAEAVTGPAFGAYNVALGEPLRLVDVATALGARPVSVPVDLVRRGASLADRLLERLPWAARGSASGWFEVLAHAPGLDTRRAQDGLQWTPRHPLDQALRSTLVASCVAP